MKAFTINKGVEQYGVVTHTKREALSKLGCSAFHFNNYGVTFAENKLTEVQKGQIGVLFEAPGEVFKQNMNLLGDATWRPVKEDVK